MKTFKRSLIFLLLTVLIMRCKKDAVPPTQVVPAPKCWEALVGNYTVYDTLNHLTYSMKIEHKDSIQTNLGYANIDSLIITNYANKFDLRVGYNCYTIPNVLRFWPNYPDYDHEGKRWALSIHADDTTTAVCENQLHNDSIVLFFNLDNIAFYYPDSVPYFSSDLKHIAVKQH